MFPKSISKKCFQKVFSKKYFQNAKWAIPVRSKVLGHVANGDLLGKAARINRHWKTFNKKNPPIKNYFGNFFIHFLAALVFISNWIKSLWKVVIGRVNCCCYYVPVESADQVVASHPMHSLSQHCALHIKCTVQCTMYHANCALYNGRGTRQWVKKQDCVVCLYISSSKINV